MSCLIDDESRDEFRRGKMVLVRFVDKSGFIRECVLDLVYVRDASSATLKQEPCVVLSYHKWDVRNIREQGYDSASTCVESGMADYKQSSWQTVFKRIMFTVLLINCN